MSETPRFTERVRTLPSGELVLPIPQEIAEKLGFRIGGEGAFRILEDGSVRVRPVTPDAPLEPDEHVGRIVALEQE